MFHLTNADVLQILDNFRRSNIRYLLATSHNFARVTARVVA